MYLDLRESKKKSHVRRLRRAVNVLVLHCRTTMLRRTNQSAEDLSAEWAVDSARDVIRDATNEEIREHFFQLSKRNATRSTDYARQR